MISLTNINTFSKMKYLNSFLQKNRKTFRKIFNKIYNFRLLLFFFILISIFFVLINNETQFEITSYPLEIDNPNFYYSPIGIKKRIDTTIKKSSGKYPYKNTTNTFKTYYKDSPFLESSISYTTGNSKIDFYTPQNQEFGSFLIPDPYIFKNTITYEEILPNAVLKYTIYPTKLLEEFIIDNREVAIKLGKITQIAKTKNIDKYVQTPNGTYDFYYKNNVVFTLPQPEMYEMESRNENTYGITYEIKELNKNTLEISKVITPEGMSWLTDPKRNYPIAIDLIIDNANIVESWVSSDPINTRVNKETVIKKEGEGSIKIQTNGLSGTGKDGILNPDGTFDLNNTASGNRYYADGIAYKLADSPGGSLITTSDTPNGIVSGDEILIINLQGSNFDCDYVGNFEILKVANVDLNLKTISLSSPIQNFYGGTDFSNQKVIIQRIPNYTSVVLDSNDVLTSSKWDALTQTPIGSAGYQTGIVALKVKDTLFINDNAKIDVKGKGYRHGSSEITEIGKNSDYYGEWFCEANGNGQDNYANIPLTTLSFGAGGKSEQNQLTSSQNDFGDGGGIVFIQANNFRIDGAGIIADGNDGGLNNNLITGGGSGGSIKLLGNSVSLGTNIVSSIGGSEINNSPNNINSGGFGKIRVEYILSILGITYPISSISNIPLSLNDTVVTSKSPQNISDYVNLTIWVRSNKTGQLMDFQFGEASVSEQTFNININKADIWEQKVWSLEQISPGDRDAVTKFGFKVLDASSDAIFYFDNIEVTHSPNTPSLDLPTDSATNQSVTPVLKTTTTVPANPPYPDYMKYKIQICENSAMNLNCHTFDQTLDATGWSGMDAESGTAYASGTQGIYTIQSANTLTPCVIHYWKSWAIDPGDSNTWSDTQATPYSFRPNCTPTQPTILRTEGLENPTNVTDLTPEFSAICNDPDTTAILKKYHIQVSTDINFGSTTWDTDNSGTSMTDCNPGARSADFSYAGTALSLNGATYYWKIRFWDEWGLISPWSSELAYFVMDLDNDHSPTNCRIQASIAESILTLLWDDKSSDEDNFRIERNKDGAGFALLNEPDADSTSYQDSDITSGSTYQYRVRAERAASTGWCTTTVIDLSKGIFNLKGVDLKGIDIR